MLVKFGCCKSMQMLRRISISLFRVILLFFFNYYASKATDILGCGGYIKSEVEIDYSLVRIKLLTQQGNLKYETECAPNNGYYFIRLYDKGDYILKVSPPAGWSFEPEEVILKVDGETDSCSLSQDINFLFKGFAVVGRVVTTGSEIGPAGVTVVLKQGEKEVLRTITSDKGEYLFSPLAAGSYDVVALHPRWNIIKNKISVVVSDKNGDAGNSIIVGGYFLSGSIAVTGRITEDVRMVLHSSKVVNHEIGCQKEKLQSYVNRFNYPPLCHVSIDTKGGFIFSSIPAGKYTVVPHFLSSDVIYEMEPTSTDVEISHHDLNIQDIFMVKGRSLRGNILMGRSAPPIGGAKVTLDQELQTVTNSKGYFSFDSVKFGEHVIIVKAGGVEFNEMKINLNLNSVAVETIVPVRYQTCFSVSVDAASEMNVPWLIKLVGNNSQHEVQTSSSRSGCLFLEPGEYRASIILTPHDEEAGIRFGPREHIFTVESQPVKNLSFSQFLGEIHGVIDCLESCRALTVSLRPSRGSTGSARTTTSSQGKFVFTEVVPGEYLLSVDKEEWCWKEQTIMVSVNAKNVTARFEQTGFRLTLNLSHRTTLSYVTNKGHVGKMDVSEGTSRECVSAHGKYVFTPISCHKFGGGAPLTWDTSSPQLLSVIASHHQVTGSLVSNEPGPFSITVKSELRQDTAIGPLEPSSADKNVYPFEIWLESGESVTLIPSSSSNLFQYNPSSYSLTMTNECMFSVVEFQAERALFLKGHINPALKGVTIKVVGEGEEFTFTTNAEGLFIAGPLDKSQDYTVTAEKVGYIMKPPFLRVEMESKYPTDIVKMSFQAFKLAEIIVEITDEEMRPLEGVLVSTSGGKNYRQNSLTDSEGTFAFQSLMPSDYFLRPMMKEYTFEPSSKMVKVEGGATVTVNITGVRVAYSVFGQTISLSGEPEAEVMIEAIGIGQHCLQLQEEALADAQGNFRIRGLVPNCDYKIQLKKGEGVNLHIDCSLPKEKVIRINASDYKGIKVVVLRPFLQMDVAIIVDTDRHYLSSLTAELYKDDSPDTPLNLLSVGQHPFFMLPPMMIDRQSYSVQLVSSLPLSQYSYSIPVVSFVANSSFIKLRMAFKPVLKRVDAEISHGTIFGLISFVLMVAIVLNYNKIQPLVAKGIEMYYDNARSVKSTGRQTSQIQLSGDSAYIEPVSVRKRIKVRKT